MKRLVRGIIRSIGLTIGFLFFSELCVAENENPVIYTPRDYSIVPAAPTVGQFFKFKDYQIDYFHGVPEISFPLYTIRYGSFEVATYNNRSHLRVNTAAGFHDITEKRRYWYLTNRQGSVMALVDSEGNVHRRSGLFPGGTPFVIDGDESTVPDMGIPSDRHHIGNRWVGFGGLNWYDNTARMHDPLLMHFNAADRQATSFFQYGPWSHCAANPANNTDPDGQVVESLWDVANVVMGAKAAYDDFSKGNIGDCLLDAFGAVVDFAAAVVPGVPGGASAAIKAARTTEKVASGVSKGVARHTASETVKTVRRGTAKATGNLTPNKSNYKRVYERKVGPVKPGEDLHHMLPQKYEERFNRVGINIHEPRYLKPMEMHKHRKNAREYNEEWRRFFDKEHDPTKEDILDKMKKMNHK